jgi:hypothetical protein
MNNDNKNGNNGSAGDLVMRVVIDLVGGRTLSVCPILWSRYRRWRVRQNQRCIASCEVSCET